MFIGVENTFALTNAVTSTSIDLPVKERIAIGTALGDDEQDPLRTSTPLTLLA